MSTEFLEKLKKKPISKSFTTLGIQLNNQPETKRSGIVSRQPVKIIDKTDLDNVKRNLAFKERIKQMKINQKVTMRLKPKTKTSMSLISPIKEINKTKTETKDVTTDTSSSPQLSFTQQKMKEIAEKRRKRKEERERKKIEKPNQR